MIGSYRALSLDASCHFLTLGVLILTCVLRLDKEIDLVSMYLRLHVLREIFTLLIYRYTLLRGML
jgi:hypothetical protein